jgi:predicted ester cyclase
MNEEENKRIVRRFIDEMWNQRKLQVADELFARDCLTHQLRSGKDSAGVPRSSDSVKREAAAWLTGFPDLLFVLEQIIAAGDQVVSYCTMRGTHSGTWMGIGPTGRKVNVPIIMIHRIAGGKIAEDWVLVGSLIYFSNSGSFLRHKKFSVRPNQIILTLRRRSEKVVAAVSAAKSLNCSLRLRRPPLQKKVKIWK